MSKLPTKRRRLLYIISIVIVIALGLASRKIMGFPYFVYEYVGDVLWAVKVYIIFAVLFPSEKIPLISVVTFFFSFLIEFSQIYHAPWIDSIRDTFIGGLVLGYGFLWSDILCYLIVTAIGAVLYSILLRYSPAKN